MVRASCCNKILSIKERSYYCTICKKFFSYDKSDYKGIQIRGDK